MWVVCLQDVMGPKDRFGEHPKKYFYTRANNEEEVEDRLEASGLLDRNAIIFIEPMESL